MPGRLVAALSALALAVMALVAPSQAPPTTDDAVHTAAKAPKDRGGWHGTGWYLQLGDSLAAGYQPDRGADPRHGYADDALGELRAEQGRTKLRNFACPGETVVTMMDGGTCDYRAGSQLDQALRFLHVHGKKTRAVTVTIGANDVVGCVLTGELDEECIAQGMTEVATRLPQVLTELREAAPRAELVVLNYYNPILAFWLTGEEGRQLAEMSLALQEQLNGAIAAAAEASGAEVADVAAAFDSADLTPVEHPEHGTVPTNVARICDRTWMCQATDIHANTEGYDVMGEAVAAQLDSHRHHHKWRWRH